MKRKIVDHWFCGSNGMYFFCYYCYGDGHIRTSAGCYSTMEEAKKAFCKFSKAY